MKLEILTILEYVEAMKAYYTETNNMNEVVQCVSPQGYEFWTKCKSLDDIGEIYWKHEPLVKREFMSEEEVIKALKVTNSSGIIGCNFRWLPGNRAAGNIVVFQPYIIKTIKDVDSLSTGKRQDRLFGILLDPFTYIGPDDVDDKGLYSDENNYRVFIRKIPVAEYLKLEKLYSDSFNGVYEDDFTVVEYGRFSGFKEDFKKFLKQNCQAWEDD